MLYQIKVLYVGDHIYGDILRSKKVLGSESHVLGSGSRIPSTFRPPRRPKAPKGDLQTPRNLFGRSVPHQTRSCSKHIMGLSSQLYFRAPGHRVACPVTEQAPARILPNRGSRVALRLLKAVIVMARHEFLGEKALNTQDPNRRLKTANYSLGNLNRRAPSIIMGGDPVQTLRLPRL
ncbi:hypothetical protein Taro_032834 [Colocasia esculenta]|uniref:Uncharacterized protein n=1 Tax=Colocasia esculenta TaxID=4460 RepID=A0A843VTP6_COLES|nr:hypothetical protein [Colocasia esculenta]